MSAIRVVVNGATGKMGVETVTAVSREPDLELVGATCLRERGTVLNTPAGEVPLSTDLGALLDEVRPDVVVDFTNAGVCMEAAMVAGGRSVHLVLGSSGLSADHLKQLDALANDNNIGIIVAPNFALGAVVLKRLAEQAAPYFDYVDIVESHHEAKIDAPSGFALALAGSLSAGKQFKRNQTERENLTQHQGRRTGRRDGTQHPYAGPERAPRGYFRGPGADGNVAPRHVGPRLLHARGGPLHPRRCEASGACGRFGKRPRPLSLFLSRSLSR